MRGKAAFKWVACLAVSLVLAFGAGSWAYAVQGSDGGESGSLVEAGEEEDKSSVGSQENHRPSSVPQGEGLSSEQEAQEPEPLSHDDNYIDEGQVSDNSFLYDAAIADLAGADSYYDEQTVRVTGEAVGEAIYADRTHSWITLVDMETDSSVTVYMTNFDVEKIDTFGAYDKTGSTLSVQGVYHLACPEHDGESDIHASVVSVAAIGATFSESLDTQDFVPGAVLTAAGFLLMALFWRMRERSR